MENELDLTIPVAIELDPSLDVLPDAADTQAFKRRLASGLNALLERLVAPHVTVDEG